MRLKDKKRTKEKKYKVSWKAGIWPEQLIPSQLPNLVQDIGAALPNASAAATATVRASSALQGGQGDIH